MEKLKWSSDDYLLLQRGSENPCDILTFKVIISISSIISD